MKKIIMILLFIVSGIQATGKNGSQRNDYYPGASVSVILESLNNGSAIFGKGPLQLSPNQPINQKYSSISKCTLTYQNGGKLTYAGSLMNGVPLYMSTNWGDGATINNYTGYVLTCSVVIDLDHSAINLSLPIRTQDIIYDRNGIHLKGTIGIAHDALALYQ